MNIAIIEPSSSGTALMDAARNLGKSVHVFSADAGDRLLGEHIRHNMASLTRVETNDPEALHKAVSRVHAAIGLEAIVPGFEYVVDVTATVAERIGFPGLPVQAARCTRNKLSIRHAMRDSGLAGPAYSAITRPEDIESAAAHVGFPAVLKPVDGCGSLMVRRVDDIKELHNAYREMTLQKFVDMGRRVGISALLESYIAGREFSIEGVINSAGPHVVAVTEKLLGAEPYFVEMGHVVEADIRVDERAALVAYVTDAVRAIGLTLGVFHAEARLSDSGPVLMEIAARLGGDRIYRLVELTKSISLPELMIRSYCGENCAIRVDAEHHRIAGIRFFTLEGSADRFEFVHGVDQVRTIDGCQEVEIYYESGHRIPAVVDFRGRIGHILFTAQNRTDLEERLQRAASTVRFLPPVTAIQQQRCIVLNRWDDDFAAYHRYIDHNLHRVAYITTQRGAARLAPELAVHIEVVADLADTAAVTVAMQRCQHALGGIDRIIALSEFDLLLAAAMRAEFAVPGATLEQVAKFRDKTIMKAAVLAAGLRAPRFAKLDDAAAVNALTARTGFPLIVKPRMGAASIGCHRVNSLAELDQLRSTLPLADYECEEFVSGPIFHVDGLIKQGTLRFIKASRYVNTCYDFAQGKPLGSILLNSGDRERALCDFSTRCLAALGLDDGAFHLEVIGEGDGFCFLEVGARVGGGEIPFLMRDLFGVDLYHAWMRIEFGVVPEIAVTDNITGGGFLMLPEPIGKRLMAYASPMGLVEGLYEAAFPPIGHTFDGKGGYETILGRFRYQGRDEASVESAIEKTLHIYQYELADEQNSSRFHSRFPGEVAVPPAVPEVIQYYELVADRTADGVLIERARQ